MRLEKPGGFSEHVDGEGVKREVFDVPLHQKHTSKTAKSTFSDKIRPIHESPNSPRTSQSSIVAQVNTDTQSTHGLDVKLLFLRVQIGILVCTCLGWTLWLILLNAAPNDTVNRIMNTATFESGSFWLLVNPSKVFMGFVTFGFSVVAIGYFAILVKMLWCRKCSKPTDLVHHEAGKPLVDKLSQARNKGADWLKRSRVGSATVKLAASLTREDNAARKGIKLILKFVDLGVETVLLYEILEAGSPSPLVVIFYNNPPLAEHLIDLLFDVLVIVGFPMLILLYCFSTFTFDYATMAINLEVFPPGRYEQSARVIADAGQTAAVYASLQSLRVMSAVNLFTKMGVNLMLCARLWWFTSLLKTPQRYQPSLYPKRSRLGAGLLILFAISLIVFVEESMRTSTVACKQHPECVVNARRWTFLDRGSLTQCPCLVMMDRDMAPKSFAEWVHPKNVTEKLAQLSTTGDLQTLHLTNRYLAILPDEFQRCTNLRHLTLEYTHTQTLPSWVKGFTQLEYLHLESKPISPMNILPDDMFQDMSSLAFLHMALFFPMKKLPSLDGLTGLKVMTMAGFHMLQELPSFDHLHNLERLVLVVMPMLDSLPDFSGLKNLKLFASQDRGTWCCNGFLGQCDLSDPKCGVHPLWRTPVATCLARDRTEKVATLETLAAVEKFNQSICGPVWQPAMVDALPTPELVNPCNGTLYRQCEHTGDEEVMCFNSRGMAISCTKSKFQIEMRRRQIVQHVGEPCDPDVEAWLGCKKK